MRRTRHAEPRRLARRLPWVPLDGPMAGHEPGMPVHYDLHVWVWSHNPSGMFATYNPSVRC